jgi:TonB family protein
MKSLRFPLLVFVFAISATVVARTNENKGSRQALTGRPSTHGLMETASGDSAKRNEEHEEKEKGRLVKGKIVSMPAPEYPQQAREEGVEGTVVVQVTMDEEGRIIAAHVNSGEPLLREAARAAAYLARFTPTTLDGKPIKVTGTINYNFKMDKKDKAKYKKK